MVWCSNQMRFDTCTRHTHCPRRGGCVDSRDPGSRSLGLQGFPTLVERKLGFFFLNDFREICRDGGRQDGPSFPLGSRESTLPASFDGFPNTPSAVEFDNDYMNEPGNDDLEDARETPTNISRYLLGIILSPLRISTLTEPGICGHFLQLRSAFRILRETDGWKSDVPVVQGASSDPAC